MRDFIILTDTRQQKENHILKEFDKQGIMHIRTGLPSADYMALRYSDKFYLDYSVLIDTKKDLEEVSSNLCNTKNHERIKNEIFKAKELGCKKFVFLIGDNKINNIEDLKNWRSVHTKVRGEVLFKIMITMQKKYNIKFIICKKKEMGARIINLLKEGVK